MRNKSYSAWILVWLLLSLPADAILRAFIMARLWLWFLSQQYGPGPTLGGWFGIGTLITLATLSLARKKDESDSFAKAWLNSWATQLLVLGIAAGIGLLFGWVK